MNITVIGGGSGGAACSVDLSLLGAKVMLYTRSKEKTRLFNKDGLRFKGALGEGVAKIKVTSNPKEAALHGELMVCTVPAYGQRDVARQLSPFLQKHHVIFLTPGTCGTFEFHKALRQKIRLEERRPLIGETTTLPYGARMIDSNTVYISATVARRSGVLRVASFPSKRTSDLIDVIEKIYRVKEAKNILETGLLNQNSIIHPPAVLLNLESIKNSGWKCNIYERGYSDCALNLIDCLDAEKKAVCKSYSIDPVSVDDIYQEYGLGSIRNRQDRRDLPQKVQERYLEEDLPFGLGLIASAANVASVKTPVCNSFFQILSGTMQKNYIKLSRSLEQYGISKNDYHRIKTILSEGWNLT